MGGDSVTAQHLLDTLRHRGVELVAVGEGLRYRPASALTPDEVELLRAHKTELVRVLTAPPTPALRLDPAELARRVSAFRRQVEAWVRSGRPGVPLLTLPDAPEPRLGRCISCGAPIPEGRWRCRLCRQAVYLALGMEPPDDDAPRRRGSEAP